MKKICDVCENEFEILDKSCHLCSNQCRIQWQTWNSYTKTKETDEKINKKFKNSEYDKITKETLLGLCKIKRPKNITGIYFLFKDRELVYIGCTDNIMRRVAQHSADKGCRGTTGKDWDYFSFIEYNKEMKERLELELFLIRKLKPIYNH